MGPGGCMMLVPLPLSQVRVHERIHTGDKPYQCSFCDYKANQRGNMRTHERRHTGEKPYKCPCVPLDGVGAGSCLLRT